MFLHTYVYVYVIFRKDAQKKDPLYETLKAKPDVSHTKNPFPVFPSISYKITIHLYNICPCSWQHQGVQHILLVHLFDVTTDQDTFA